MQFIAGSLPSSLFWAMSSIRKSDNNTNDSSVEKPSFCGLGTDVKNGEESSEAEVDFGGASSLPPPPVLTPQEERRLYRKIDCRIMPIVTLMYLGAFLDRGK